MRAQITLASSRRRKPGLKPELKDALRPVPHYERAVREVSKLFSKAGIRHALVGALGANAYRDRPRTTEDIVFFVGDEAFDRHAGGLVTMRVPVVEFDGIDVDQVPLTEALRGVEAGLVRYSSLIANPRRASRPCLIAPAFAPRVARASAISSREVTRATSSR